MYYLHTLFSHKDFMVISKEFAIDLGNNNTLIFDSESILFSESTCIVVTELDQTTFAIGDKALDMFEKTPQRIKAVKPLKGGVIAHYNYAEQMLKAMVHQSFPHNKFFNRFDHIISGVPYDTTEVEKRALRDVLEQFSPRSVHLVYEPLAAALGMGLDVQEPNGKCIVDMGGGITEIAIVSLSGVVTHESLRVAGDTFTDDIQEYIRRQYNLAIGFHMAESAKIQVGSALHELTDAPNDFMVLGKNTITGIPTAKQITYTEIAQVLDRSIIKIEEAITRVLEASPPELASDIYENGVYLTGGGSLLRGMKDRLQRKFDLIIHQDQEPLLSVSKGLGKILGASQKHKALLMV